MNVKLDIAKDSINYAYDAAKNYRSMVPIYKDGEKFINNYIIKELKNFYKNGIESPQYALRLKNDARYSAAIGYKPLKTFKQRMTNKFMNILMDMRIKKAMMSDSELKKLKRAFDKKLYYNA